MPLRPDEGWMRFAVAALISGMLGLVAFGLLFLLL